MIVCMGVRERRGVKEIGYGKKEIERRVVGIGVMSMMGVPPTGGFLGKYIMVIGIVNEGKVGVSSRIDGNDSNECDDVYEDDNRRV